MWSPRAARVRRKLRVVTAVVVGNCRTAPKRRGFDCCPDGHSGRVSSLLERPAGVRTASRLCEIFVDRLYPSWNPNHEISRGRRLVGRGDCKLTSLARRFKLTTGFSTAGSRVVAGSAPWSVMLGAGLTAWHAEQRGPFSTRSTLRRENMPLTWQSLNYRQANANLERGSKHRRQD